MMRLVIFFLGFSAYGAYGDCPPANDAWRVRRLNEHISPIAYRLCCVKVLVLNLLQTLSG
uniref:Hypothetical secreted protein n=1 Tax=Ornithodoros coriaceus TaxID=92741 RepID=B2D2B4_ORNCO|nr:hypothetical secreted protein precursor [Ornithodoros coriaceus]